MTSAGRADRVPAGGHGRSGIVFGQTTVTTAGECVQLTTEKWDHSNNGCDVIIVNEDSATFYIGTGTVGTDLSNTGLQLKANNQYGVRIPCLDPSTLRVDSAGSSKSVCYCIVPRERTNDWA